MCVHFFYLHMRSCWVHLHILFHCFNWYLCVFEEELSELGFNGHLSGIFDPFKYHLLSLYSPGQLRTIVSH